MVLGNAGLYFGIKGCVLFHVDMVCSSSDKLCHSAVGRDYHNVHQQTTVRTVDAVTAKVSIAHDL